MIVHINTFGLCGIKGFYVDAEINLAHGLPYLDIIGMGNTAVKEAADRIKPAIENSGYSFPLGKITVNLAPASIKKEGTYFDLAIAIGILKCTGIINNPIDHYAFIGELSLEGILRPVKGILPLIQAANDIGINNCIVPLNNADEAALISNVNIYPANTLNDVIQIVLRGSAFRHKFNSSSIDINLCGDFSEVKGQGEAVRAAEIAASGGHNILFIGAPGCGKTMIAKRIQSIMPDLSYEESVEVTPVYSVLGMIQGSCSLIQKVPFRTVYPDVSKAGLIGGGTKPMPGEISLAHKGILFLDELAEFDKNIIQGLRQPIEDGIIRISRCGEFVEFPSDFMLVAASNPCRCGKMLEGNGMCTCTPLQAKKYLSKISKPLLDRIDMHVPVRRVDFNCLHPGESSQTIKNRVVCAREIQKYRFNNQSISLNGKMSGRDVYKFCSLTSNAEKLLNSALSKSNTSMRGYEKILKISRTIADLNNLEKITENEVAEAMQFRFLDSFNDEVISQ